MERHNTNNKEESRIPAGLILTLTILIVVIASAGAYLYRTEEHRIKDHAATELTATANLRTNQIVEWRQDRPESKDLQ